MKPFVLAALLASGLAIRGGPPSCVEVAAHPDQYIGTTVTLLAIEYLVSSTTVHAALEVPMPSGRFQVKVVMPYLTGVTIHAP